MLQERRDAFMAKNTGKNAATLAGELERLIESTIDDLQQQEAIKDRLLSEITTTLEASRKKVEYESKRIRALRSKLSVLGESRDNNALLRFIVAYAGGVSDALEELEKDAAAAAGAAVETGGE